MIKNLYLQTFVLQSRAQVATQLLLELNPDVQGDFVDEVYYY